MRKSLSISRYLKTIETTGPGEHVLCTIFQHPFGLIAIYVASVIILIGTIGLSGTVLPQITGERVRTLSGVALGGVLVSLVVLGVLIVSTYVYRKSKLTVTDRTVVQIIQRGLFIRKISQISLSNIEDVTSEQKGIFANMFGFGTLNIETAGEQANFHFSMCPNPHRVAQIILDAKDDFLVKTGQTGNVRNRPRA